MIHLYRLTVMLIAVLVLGACGIPSVVSDSPGPESVVDRTRLVESLKAAGATVEIHDPIRQPFFTPEGQLIGVGSTDLQVFEYASAGDMEKEAAQVAPDGGSVGTSMVNWVEPPHFYKAGRIIVLYIGSDPTVLKLLQKVVGAQFAGR